MFSFRYNHLTHVGAPLRQFSDDPGDLPVPIYSTEAPGGGEFEESGKKTEAPISLWMSEWATHTHTLCDCSCWSYGGVFGYAMTLYPLLRSALG